MNGRQRRMLLTVGGVDGKTSSSAIEQPEDRKKRRLALEAMVANCINTLNALYDTVSNKVIMYVSTLFLALFAFTLNSEEGFSTIVSAEHSVVPVATSLVVVLELFVVGVFYGFPRVCANILRHSNCDQDNDFKDHTAITGMSEDAPLKDVLQMIAAQHKLLVACSRRWQRPQSHRTRPYPTESQGESSSSLVVNL
ncbi:hypothetical protein TELCIR_13203 [Teladorsagia circumcincta]|uniref:Uncharacterized protein n=1 Tax=Teladorsagia circumcincta TaxID=45464 RepID=A0A2G9U4E3_TELCI|nr:hypothetical protein TELCIR_13203 [Teladorsagia circumcincta]